MIGYNLKLMEACVQNPEFEIKREDVRWERITDFYDFPQAGEGVYKGKPCYIACHDYDHQHITYCVILLDKEQYNYCMQWRKLFEENVGTHLNTNPDGTRKKECVVHGEEDWFKFYEPYKTSHYLDLSKNTGMGWYRI